MHLYIALHDLSANEEPSAVVHPLGRRFVTSRRLRRKSKNRKSRHRKSLERLSLERPTAALGSGPEK